MFVISNQLSLIQYAIKRPESKSLLVAILFLITSSHLFAHELKLQQKQAVLKQSHAINISNSYMPEVSPVSRTAAIYMKLYNSTDSTVTLTSVTTSIARHVMIHQTIEEDGLFKMKHREELILPAKESVELSPGGIHLMLMGIDIDKSAKNIEVTLEYKAGNKQVILVPIRKKNG